MSILSELANEKFALEMARRLDEFERRLKALESGGLGAGARVRRVVNVVAKEFNVSEAAILGRARWSEAVRARFVCYHLVVILLEMNHSQMAREFGRDHKSIQNGIEQIGQLAANADTARAIGRAYAILQKEFGL